MGVFCSLTVFPVGLFVVSVSPLMQTASPCKENGKFHLRYTIFRAQVLIIPWQFKFCLLIFPNMLFVINVLKLMLLLLLLPPLMLAKVSVAVRDHHSSPRHL